MHNTMDVLPIDVQPQAQQSRKSAASSTYGGIDFSEAIGSATDRVNKKPGKNAIAEDKADKKLESNTNITDDEAQPTENIEDAGDMTAEQIIANGYVNIQQMVAGLIIGNTNEDETMDTIGQEAKQPMIELPQQQQQTVDVLEGLQITDIENGVNAQPQVAEPAGQAADAEAWMPTDSSEAKIQQPIQPKADAPVDLQREIESRLEEHLRPLENINPTEQKAVDTNEPNGEMIQFDTNDIEIDVKETKDDLKSIDDIQGGSPAAQEVAQAETPGSPADDMGEDDGKDANEQQPTMVAANHEAQPQKTGIEKQSQRVQETVFNKMVENISTNAQQGKRAFSINLRPDFMGEMNIELVMTEAGLSAKIKADPQVNSLISQQLFKLEQSLKEQGIDVVNLEVSVFDTGEFGKEDFSRQSSSQGERNGKADRIGRIKAVAQEAIMAAGMETLSENQTVEALGMGSSVEYTA